MQKVNIDFIKQNVPQFFYKRLNLNNLPKSFFIVPIEMGYAFLLRTIRAKWPGIGNDGSVAMKVKVEFIQQVSQRELQDDPYPINLICSPNSGGAMSNGTGLIQGVFFAAAPAPVDNSAFNINFSANPVKNNIILNYFYQRQEDVYLKVSFAVLDPAEAYVDLLMVGYYVPDLTRKEWS